MLDVIDQPNLPGANCNLIPMGQSIGFATGAHLPNFPINYFFPLPSPFTYTSNMAISCNTASFTAPASVAAANSLCASVGSTVNALVWNFGDPASGPANTSTLSNPVHVYPGPGTYTTQLIIYYQCRSDTLRQPVVITSPTININTSSVSCNGLGTATAITLGGSGSYSYTWSPGSQTTAVASNLSPGMYTLSMVDNGGGCVGTMVVGVSPALISGAISSQSLACNGIATGTAGISVNNGSGNYTYNWSGSALTTATVNALAAGGHTVTVNDLTNNCSFSTSFSLAQPPALSLNITAGSATACVNTNISLSANATGGTGPYTYTWLPGAVGASAVATQSNGGTYSYSVNALDANVCSISANTTLSFVNNPSLSVSNASICPLQTGTLTAFGANTYTWLPSNSSGNSFTQSPMATAQYTVLGTANSCTAQATASIVVKATPVPTLSTNAPLCNNQSLNLSATGGTAYVWSGPLGFNSSAQNPVINPAAPNQSGLYSATLTGANSCTAAASVSVTVHPTPTLSVPGVTLCSNQNMSLSAVSVAGASYYWQGPASFTSNAQFPVVATPPASLSGLYQVTVTSAQNCSNTASANVTITALPNVSITANSPLCFGSALFLSGSGALNYNWAGPNGFSSAAQNTSLAAVSFSQAGTYSLTATTGPCVVWLTKTITVNLLPNPTAAYNTPLCELKPLYLVAGPAQSYTWSGPQNFSSTLQSPSLAAVGFSNAGQYSLSVTDGNGCVGHTSLVVNVLSNPIPIASGATVCLGGNVSLSASGGIAYSWSGPNNFSANTQNLYLQNIVANQTGNYTVIVTGSNSCSSYTTANLQGFNYSLPNPTIVATSSVCVNSNISLQGFGGVSYYWTGPANFSSSSPSTTFIATQTSMCGTYTLSVSNASYCVGSNTVFIQVYPLPSATLISSQNNRCVPFCTEFSLLRDPASASLQSFQYFIEGQFYTEPVAKACITQSGQQKANVYYSDVHSCSNASTLLISAYPKPRAEFEYFPAKPIAGIDRVEFTNRTQGSKQNGWAWLFSSGDSLWGENVSFLFQEAGTYPVALLVSNEWNCLDTVIKAVPVLEDFALYVPNAFTPNGDGLNDVFRAAGTGIHSYRLEIYNRWGHNLFASEDFLQGWDGYYKGEPSQEDVYSYKIIYSTEGGKTFEKSGWVMLER
ncbi:MAG: gliding motility-associated C-terminal domain-containing protein [Bacteroidia bacterium]|nr:gliding motility-associated C-terminal domain-containing protein [Bacteroidia bacterium]